MTNQNSIQEEIKCRFKEENSYSYSVQTLLTIILSENVERKVLKYEVHSLLIEKDGRVR